ncbi:MAG TPA: type II toxin-antitoxin system RelE/ParE family toxin [Phycisphaerae bacterium]|nr:type II toxin-antitoxin system RelE/ParE family toxin [Phycisphaerae bacterium]
MRVELTEAALTDLDEIYNYIARDSIQAAEKVLADLKSAMQRLGDLPGMGHERKDVKNPHYRFWRVYSYMAAYVVRGDVVYIVRIVHGSRDVERVFDPHRSSGVDPKNN